MSSILQILGIWTPSLDNSLGAVLLGVILGSMLYGLTVHQTYRYFKLYPKDPWYLKSLILTILVFETLHTVAWIIVIYHYSITEAFNFIDIFHGHWSVQFSFLITGLAVFVCQCFYARRVFLLGPRYRWLVIPAVVSMFGSLGFAAAAGIEAFITAANLSGLQRISWLVSIAYGLAAGTDIILTSLLVLVLHVSRTGSKRTDSILNTLIIYTINTGLLTSIVSIAAFVLALVMPENLIYAAVSIVGAKLYANSVLAVLNSRRSIDNRFLDDFSSFSLASLDNASSGQQPQPVEGDIESVTHAVPAVYPKPSAVRTQSLIFASVSESETGVRM